MANAMCVCLLGSFGGGGDLAGLDIFGGRVKGPVNKNAQERQCFARSN